jgi:hypothetical protein
LLANPLERVFDRRLRRPTHFELGDQAIDLVDVSIDGPALVAAGRTREGDVADRRGHAHRNLAEAAPLLRRRRRLAPLLALLGVLLIAHEASMTNPSGDRSTTEGSPGDADRSGVDPPARNRPRPGQGDDAERELARVGRFIDPGQAIASSD